MFASCANGYFVAPKAPQSPPAARQKFVVCAKGGVPKFMITIKPFGEDVKPTWINKPLKECTWVPISLRDRALQGPAKPYLMRTGKRFWSVLNKATAIRDIESEYRRYGIHWLIERVASIVPASRAVVKANEAGVILNPLVRKRHVEAKSRPPVSPKRAESPILPASLRISRSAKTLKPAALQSRPTRLMASPSLPAIQAHKLATSHPALRQVAEAVVTFVEANRDTLLPDAEPDTHVVLSPTHSGSPVRIMAYRSSHGAGAGAGAMPPLDLAAAGPSEEHILVHTGNLGKGGFKDVGGAVDYKSGRRIAVAEIPISCLADKQAVEKEISIYQALHGVPHVAKLLDHIPPVDSDFGAGEDNCPVWKLVMPEYQHGNLEEYLNKVNLNVHQRLRLARQIALGVEGIHAKHIVHRDLKLLNILIGEEEGKSGKAPMAFISDFGTACYTRELDDLRDNVGTLDYKAPEVRQLQKHRASLPIRGKPADIWSLGLTLRKLMGPYQEPLGQLLIQMQHNNPKLRPPATEVFRVIDKLCH